MNQREKKLIWPLYEQNIQECIHSTIQKNTK